MRPKCLPGPVATSCLTCRRRRKKCDRSRPACERCAQDKQDCLGYDHIHERLSTTGSTWNSKHDAAIQQIVFSAHPSSLEGSQPEQPCTNSTELGMVEATECSLSLSNTSAHTPAQSVLNFNTINYRCDIDSSASGGMATEALLRTSNSRSPRARFTDNQPRSIGRSPATYVPWSNPRQELDAILSPDKAYPSPTPSMDVSLPRKLPAPPPSSQKLIGFILSQYERIFGVMYLTPKHQHALRLRNHLLDRLQGSSIARCALFISAKMFESRLDSPSSNHRGDLRALIQQFEQKLLLVSASSLQDLQDHLSGTLEVAFLKMQLSFTPQLLSSTATIFLEIVYSDPTLWPSPCGPPTVSLNRIFSSTRYELGRFAMLDITCAMAYGVPQLIDYDTTAPAIRPSDHPIEWVQGCPSEFLFCIAEINRRYSNGYIAHDWHLVEQRIRSFEAHPSDAQDVEPWIAVARLAIIESWRQTLLIYLYMAVCGVDSDDRRVQSAVHQLFQLFRIVRKQKPPKANMRLVFQCLLAGLCTRSENQRAYVRERLLDSYGNKLWLLPGSQFVPVLDDVWHGGAANGKPIKWRDYILSRQRALPLSL